MDFCRGKYLLCLAGILFGGASDQVISKHAAIPERLGPDCLLPACLTHSLFPPQGHVNEVTGLDWCRSEELKLASSSDDETVRIWTVDPVRRAQVVPWRGPCRGKGGQVTRTVEAARVQTRAARGVDAPEGEDIPSEVRTKFGPGVAERGDSLRWAQADSRARLRPTESPAGAPCAEDMDVDNSTPPPTSRHGGDTGRMHGQGHGDAATSSRQLTGNTGEPREPMACAAVVSGTGCASGYATGQAARASPGWMRWSNPCAIRQAAAREDADEDADDADSRSEQEARVRAGVRARVSSSSPDIHEGSRDSDAHGVAEADSSRSRTRASQACASNPCDNAAAVHLPGGSLSMGTHVTEGGGERPASASAPLLPHRTRGRDKAAAAPNSGAAGQSSSWSSSGSARGLGAVASSAYRTPNSIAAAGASSSVLQGRDRLASRPAGGYALGLRRDRKGEAGPKVGQRATVRALAGEKTDRTGEEAGAFASGSGSHTLMAFWKS